MANQIFEEFFIGKYNGVSPIMLLAPGDIADGANVRKVSEQGGWKARKGCSLYNTTALQSGSAIDSLHVYKNPKSLDYHFIGQCNSKLLDLAADPPGSYSSATDLGVTVGTTPGFSDVVGENWFYADGSGRPITWGGDTPLCSGFLVWDNSATALVDYTRKVTDGRSDTYAVLGNAASDVYYVCSPEIAESITLDIVTVNTTDATTCKVYSWVAGAWAERSAGFSDGTLASSKTHAQDGTISWTRNSTDTMRVLGGIMGYWYKVEPQAALTDGVTIASATVVRDATAMSNKWNGVYEWVHGCRFYDHSETEYVECLGLIGNESQSQYVDLASAATDDYLYIKVAEPATLFGFGVVTDDQNTSDAQVDLIEYWNGNAWTTVGTLTDTTLDGGADSSFSQSGSIAWNAAAITPHKRTFQGDEVPGYWYRVSWDAALGADCAVYMIVYAPFPEVLPTYDGCVEFKGRLLVWGDPEFPNRLRYSALAKPDCLSGSDSGYTRPFGDEKKILCAKRFYNELIVWKEDSIFLLEGHSPDTFGILQISDRIGLASPKSAQVIQLGSPTMHKDEPLSIAIWQEVDGVYLHDGRKPKKVSMPVDHYFNTEYSTAIAAANIRNRQAFMDPINNEYHLLLPTKELVYNFVTDEWYPPWTRQIALKTGLSLRGSSNRNHTYGGSSSGFIMRLENDTTDKNTSNADVAISHSIKTRGIGAAEKGLIVPFEFTLRKLWARFKARTAGSITTKTFKNSATSGTTQSTPEAMSMINSGYNMAVPGLTLSEYRCNCFQVEFALNTVDQEMEVWSMPYELDVISEASL